MRVWRVLSATAVAAALALSGCGGGSVAEPAGTRAAGAGPDLDFTVATLDGGMFEGASLAGKPAVLWFWAPWCPTCVAEAPDVTELAATYEGRAMVVGVAGLDTVAAMREFVKLTRVDSFPQLADEQGVVWKRFGVTAQSTFVLLDADGNVAASGYLEPEELKTRVEGLVSAA